MRITRTTSGLVACTLGVGLAAAGLAGVAPAPASAATPVEIQVLATNDFHGRILQNASGGEAGAAVLAGAVEQLRGDNPDTVFAAAGDLIGASTFESFIQHDKPTLDALNAAGLEVSAVGNHELDQGYDDLVNRVMAPYDATTNPEGGAQWHYIAANLKLKTTGDDAVPATWIKTMDGVDVGFVGAVTEELPALVSPAGIADLNVTDIVDSVNTEATDLRAHGADVVVALIHEGSDSTDCDSASFSDPNTVWGNITQNLSPDVDAIVSGHTHLAYNCHYPVEQWATEGRPVTERPVVSAGRYGVNLNKLVFSVDPATGQVQAVTQDILPLMGPDPDGSGPGLPPALYPADPAVNQIVNDAKAQADVLGARPLGKVAAAFNRAKLADGTTENRGGESTLGNLVAEAQRWATEKPESGSAQIAFMNPGGLRADMTGGIDGETGYPKTLTYKQAAVVQPFANTLVNMDMTGAQIKTVLEQQWQRDSSNKLPSRPFLRLGVSDGFTYTYTEKVVTETPTDGSPSYEAPKGTVTGMWLNGEPIDPAATYSVTVNSFLASGGDNFREFAKGAHQADTGKIDLSAMVDYMAQFAGSTPLAPDYSQRAVEVEIPEDAPAAYHPGDHVRLDVASWSMSTADDAKDAAIQVKLGDTVLGTVPVDNTVPATNYDDTGTASVDVTLPDDVAVGDHDLTLVGATTGTEVIVPITVEAAPSLEVTAPSTISGKAKVGKTLTGTPATFSPAPESVTYQWLADGVPIPGATDTTFEPGKAQVGKEITFQTIATATGYADTVSTSEPTAPVKKGSVKLKVTVSPDRIHVRDTHVVVSIVVTSPDGLRVTGDASVDANLGGGEAAGAGGNLVDGKARFRLPAFNVRGERTLRIKYSGSALLAPASKSVTIRVVR